MTCVLSKEVISLFKLFGPLLFSFVFIFSAISPALAKNVLCEDHLSFSFIAEHEVKHFEFSETHRKGILALAWSEELNPSMYALEISKDIYFPGTPLFRGMRLTPSELNHILKNGMTSAQISDPHFDGLYFSNYFREALRYSLSSSRKESALSVIFVMKSDLRAQGTSGFAHSSVLVKTQVRPEDIHTIYVFDPNKDPLEAPLRELKIRRPK